MISSEGQTTFSRLFPFLFMLMPFSQILHCSFFYLLFYLLFVFPSFDTHIRTQCTHTPTSNSRPAGRTPHVRKCTFKRIAYCHHHVGCVYAVCERRARVFVCTRYCIGVRQYAVHVLLYATLSTCRIVDVAVCNQLRWEYIYIYGTTAGFVDFFYSTLFAFLAVLDLFGRSVAKNAY